MNKYVYDLEVFPNFFCVTFLNVDTQVKLVFSLSQIQDDRRTLIKFLDQPMELIGFNNINYDGPVLHYLISYAKNLPADQANAKLFNVSGRLIDDDNHFDRELMNLRYPKNIKYHQVDLMKIMAFDNRVSLKQVAVNLKWRRIQDLPLPYDQPVTQDEIAIVLDYNWNDVQITHSLYKSIQPLITLRQDLSKVYGVDLTSASDSKMANLMLEHIYTTEAGVNLADIRDLRTQRQTINLADCIGQNIGFRTSPLIKLLEDLKLMTLSIGNKFSFSKEITIGNTTYDLGVGGIHSQDQPGKFVAEEGYILRDADVASYYPNILIVNNIAPAHLNRDDFIRILKKITAERIAAKKAGDKVKADGLKITINSIFGKLASDTFWLEDALGFISVTVSGQLYLLMLIEALEHAGIEVISANTDGMVAKIPAYLEGVYDAICARWQKDTGFELEFSDYALYVRSDVNNYLTKKKKGEIKAKGRYVQEIDLKKAYRHPIIPRCIYEYFMNGVPVEDTLAKATDILDFCISQKSSRDFKLEYRTAYGGCDVLQKTNRFYISKHGGVLVKVKQSTGGETGLYVGNVVQLLNDLDPDKAFGDYDLDLDFYRYEAQKCIEEVEPSIVQLSLF